LIAVTDHMPGTSGDAVQDAILLEMARRGLIGNGQEMAFDMSVMGGPMQNAARRAENYRFSEPGNVGQNVQRALRELEALEIMQPNHYGRGMAGRPLWAN